MATEFVVAVVVVVVVVVVVFFCCECFIGSPSSLVQHPNNALIALRHVVCLNYYRD